jgi:hypothetical protein
MGGGCLYICHDTLLAGWGILIESRGYDDRFSYCNIFFGESDFGPGVQFEFMFFDY